MGAPDCRARDRHPLPRGEGARGPALSGAGRGTRAGEGSFSWFLMQPGGMGDCFLISDFGLHLSVPSWLKGLPRLQDQPVDRPLIHCRIAEQHRKAPPAVPGFKLVAIVGAKDLARFS